MGQVTSAIVSGIEGIADSIAKQATDTVATVGQLKAIATQLVAVPSLRFLDSPGLQHLPPSALAYIFRAPSIAFADPASVQTALKAAMTGASGAVKATYKAQFPSVPAGGTDNGAVNPYNAGGDLSSVVSTIQTNFTNWNLPVDQTQMGQMAGTIQNEVQAQLGASGTAYGRFYLNANQSVVWAVAYGMFVVATPSTNGLVYAFTAGLDSGF
jgi:hypothetical protein